MLSSFVLPHKHRESFILLYYIYITVHVEVAYPKSIKRALSDLC